MRVTNHEQINSGMLATMQFRIFGLPTYHIKFIWLNSKETNTGGECSTCGGD
jgi:hypothetical protein